MYIIRHYTKCAVNLQVLKLSVTKSILKCPSLCKQTATHTVSIKRPIDFVVYNIVFTEVSDPTGRTQCPIILNNWLNNGLTRWNSNSHSLEYLIIVNTYQTVRVFRLSVFREKARFVYRLFKPTRKPMIFQPFWYRYGATPILNVTIACDLKITLLERHFRTGF